MIMWEQDPDVVRWGLHLLSDPYSSTVYCEVPTSNIATFCDGENAREGNLDLECTAVENDEIIAHALQEEFSQVAAAEASGALQEGSDHLQASVLAQDWLGPPMQYVCSDNGGVHGDAYYVEPSSSCSSPGEQPYEGEVWTLELMDDFSPLDGEVGKRLDQLVPVPHVPRINGEIPSIDEATSDHQRLLDRLRLYDLSELKVEGDGNCQFRALSDQFYRTTDHHKFVRKQVVQQYGVKIFVITSFKDTCSIEILPAVLKSKRVIFLSFWAEVHYNSIYPEGELPTMEARRNKKRWWHF